MNNDFYFYVISFLFFFLFEEPVTRQQNAYLGVNTSERLGLNDFIIQFFRDKKKKKPIVPTRFFRCTFKNNLSMRDHITHTIAIRKNITTKIITYGELIKN